MRILSMYAPYVVPMCLVFGPRACCHGTQMLRCSLLAADLQEPVPSVASTDHIMIFCARKRRPDKGTPCLMCRSIFLSAIDFPVGIQIGEKKSEKSLMLLTRGVGVMPFSRTGPDECPNYPTN